MSCNCCCSVPILYYDDLSPQARSCYMLIKVLEIDVELKPINLINGEHFSEEYSKINPSCTVPALIDGNLTLYDGHTIMIYLCDKFAHAYNPQLCPKRYLTRLEVLNLLFYEGCVLYRRHSHLLTDILLEKFPNVDIDYHKRKIADCYNALNTFLIGHCFMVGNCMTIADFSMISTVGALDLMFPINRNLWPNLSTWFDRLRIMPWYKLNEDGIKKQRKLLQAVGEFPFPSPLIITELMTPHSSFRADGYESLINQVLDEDESIKRQPSSETGTSQALRETELDKRRRTDDQMFQRDASAEKQRISETTVTRSLREEAYELTQILYQDDTNEGQRSSGTVPTMTLREENREEELRTERLSVDSRKEKSSGGSRIERLSIGSRAERSSVGLRTEKSSVGSRTEKSSVTSRPEKSLIGSRAERSSFESRGEKSITELRTERLSHDSRKDGSEVERSERWEIEERSDRSTRDSRKRKSESGEQLGRLSRDLRKEKAQSGERSERSSVELQRERISTDSRRERMSVEQKAAQVERSPVGARTGKPINGERAERSVVEVRSERSSTEARCEKKEKLRDDERASIEYVQQGFIEMPSTQPVQRQAPQTTEIDEQDMISSVSKLSVDNREFSREGNVEELYDGKFKQNVDDSENEGEDKCDCMKDVRKSYFEIKNLLKRQSEEFKKAIQKYPEFLTVKAKKHRSSCICPDCAISSIGQDRYDMQRMKLELEFYKKDACEPENLRVVNCDCNNNQEGGQDDDYYYGEDYEATTLMRLKKSHERPGGGQNTADSNKNVYSKSKAQMLFCQHGDTEVPPELTNASLKDYNPYVFANTFETSKAQDNLDKADVNCRPAFPSITSANESPSQQDDSAKENVDRNQIETPSIIHQKLQENTESSKLRYPIETQEDERRHSASAQTILNFGRALSDTILNTAKYNCEGKFGFNSHVSGVTTPERPNPSVEHSPKKTKKVNSKEIIINGIDTTETTKKAVAEHQENNESYAFKKDKVSKSKIDDTKHNERCDYNRKYEDSQKSISKNEQYIIRKQNDDNNENEYDKSENVKEVKHSQTKEKLSENISQQPEKSRSNSQISTNKVLIPNSGNNGSDQKVSTYTKIEKNNEEKCVCKRGRTSSRHHQYPSPPCSLADFRKCSVCREKRKLQIDSQSKRYKIEIEAKGCKEHVHNQFGQKPIVEEKEIADKNKFKGNTGEDNKDNINDFKIRNEKNIRLRAGNCGSKHLQICYMDKDVLIKMPQDLKSLVGKTDSSESVDNSNSDSLCSLTSISNASEEIACVNYYDHYKDQRPTDESNRVCFHHSKYLCRRCLKTLTSVIPKETCVLPHMYGSRECMGTAPLQAASGCHDLTKPGLFRIPEYSGCVCGCKCRKCLFKSVFNYPGDSSQLWSEYVRYPIYEKNMNDFYELPKVNSTYLQISDKVRRKAMGRQQAAEDLKAKPSFPEINKFAKLKQHLTPGCKSLFLLSDNDDNDNEKKDGFFNYPKTLKDRSPHDMYMTPYQQKLKKLTFSTSSENKIISEPESEVHVKDYDRDSAIAQRSKSRIPRLLMKKRVDRSPTRETTSNDEKASKVSSTNAFYDLRNSSNSDLEEVANTKMATIAVPSPRRRNRKFFWYLKNNEKKRESRL
uniref:GST N-terminal domain-containing protein n=1 Tax=Glossina palpalis gambiensis TaxID=67801 RepID=A0A1B0AKP8_9MUSC